MPEATDPYYAAREELRIALLKIQNPPRNWNPSQIDKRIHDELCDLITEAMGNADNLSNAFCAARAARKGGVA